ncbi:hypothetical protein BASA81_008839 [Batrachochytrium salamandrivorans]|nr:hypothetical protein BASA81_008839 [Batrachochytrium salamandrivorans]
MLPAGYSLDSCALSLRVVDLHTSTLHGTVGYRLVKTPSLSNSNDNLNTLRLNSRNLAIESVWVNGIDRKFTLVDFLNEESLPLTNLDSFSACLAGDLAVANSSGELVIPLPTLISHKSEDVLVEIHYSLVNPTCGVCVFKTNLEDAQDDHMFTRVGFHSSPSGSGARCLFPTLDGLGGSRTGGKIPKMHVLIETNKTNVALAPGRLVGTTVLSNTTHLYEYDHPDPICPFQVNLCVGPFVRSPALPTMPWFTSWSLASGSHRLNTSSAKPLIQTLQALVQYLGITPKPYTQVFVDTEEQLIPSSTLCLLPDSFVVDAEREWVSSELQAHSLLFQLTGVALQTFGQISLDTWIPVGLSLFCALRSLPTAVQSLVLHTWLERISHTDARANKVNKLVTKPGLVLGRQLTQPKPYSFPVDSALWQMRLVDFSSTFASKCGVVMRMLEQRASALVFQDCLQRITQLRPHQQMSELAFLTLLKLRASQMGSNRQLALDIDSTFVTQWIRHSHMPKFTGEVAYNAKTNKIDICLRQQGGIYTGAIKLRIVEAGGTWDYEKQIDNIEHRWTFDLRTPRRKGKGGRKKRLVEEKEEGWRHPEALQANTLLQMAKTKDRYWESNSTVRYVVLDPDTAWTMDLQWKQPEEFWLEMLHDTQLGENVAMQIWALRQFASGITGLHLRASSAITAVAVDTTRHDLVRVEALYAALSLHNKFAPATLNSTDANTSWMGMNLLISAFKQLYCSSETGEPNPFTTKNGEYAVRTALLDVLSQIRAKDGSIPEEILEVVFDSVRMCDNSGNAFDDGPMLSGLAVCAGNICKHAIANPSEDTEECLRWIQSALDFDSVSPNYRKQTTIGCLQALCELEMHGSTSSTDFVQFLSSRDSQVRITAFECVVRLQVLHRKDMHTLGQVLLRQCLPQELCIATRHKMLKILLNAYADSEGKCFQQLLFPGGNKDGSGNGDVEQALWELMIRKQSGLDSELRMLCHQLWRLIYGLDYPHDRAIMDLGELQNWAKQAQEEWSKDEDTLISMEQINAMQEKQREIREREEETKRLQREQNQQQEEVVMMGEEEIIIMEEDDDDEEEEEEDGDDMGGSQGHGHEDEDEEEDEEEGREEEVMPMEEDDNHEDEDNDDHDDDEEEEGQLQQRVAIGVVEEDDDL